MSTKKFPIDSAEVEKAKKATSGTAHIAVYIDGDHDHDVNVVSVAGFYSWAGIYSDDSENLRIFYGSDLTTGVHVFDAAALSVFYTDSDDVQHFSPEGSVTVYVAPGRTLQVGVFDVVYNNTTPPIKLFGYYALNI
ncbi:hypothetical protein [Pseudomonas trivialis]|uniref:Uncharacterized protein n=1 Tax=Pseudomonas trivialis TaxID=200450 RepID=A0A0H5ATM8_9PSED|nr:hypothetical protein [Pseudomonas trivialis]AKS07732.1 hypothetical protein AA957_16890 [Pseudomonas trivialis]